MSLKRFPKRALVVCVAVAAGALSLAVTTSAAPGVKVTTSLQFTPPSDFHGKVSSKDDDCEAGARVTLWRFDSAADTTPDKLGTDKANKKGAWGIDVPNAQQGEYQAQVAGRTVGEHDDEVKCKLYVGARLQF